MSTNTARFFLSVAIALTAMSGVAHAQEPKKDCEPGSWFCGDTQTNGGKDLQPLPDSKPAETKPSDTPPPVVVYQPPPPTVVIQPRDAPPAYYYVPKRPVRAREWGLNLHLGGAMLPNRDNNGASMWFSGVGLRYRPIGNIAVEADLDFAGGTDFNGYTRGEMMGTINGLLFLNPKSVTQVYLLGGIGGGGARAQDFQGYNHTYGYFGVQAGVGLEFRVARSVALNVDLRGLIRSRIDDDRRLNPEFVREDGRSTNTSGAGTLQGGITFYW